MVTGSPQGSSGVKVYDVVPAADVLIDDGFHEPLSPLSDVVGNAGAALFKQYGPNSGNVGITELVIVTCMVTGSPQGSSGVKVYDVVPAADVLIDDVFHDPVTPLSDVVGNAAALLFKQYGPNAGNVGITELVMVTCMVTGSPQGSSGVKVYDEVPAADVLIDAGLHEPVNPLSDVVGNVAAVLFKQYGPNAGNVGITELVIVTCMVTGSPQGSSGVKVYDEVPVADVLIDAGLHEPVNPLSDVVGNAGAVLFKQYGPNAGNVGVTDPVMVICMVTGSPQGSSGVKVYDDVPVADVLIDAGLHEPVNPLSDVVGNASAVLFEQYGRTAG